MMLGEVRAWNAKGFGWIATDKSVSCFFVHASDVYGLRGALRPGQKVKFLPLQTERGPRAVAVERIEPVPVESGK